MMPQTKTAWQALVNAPLGPKARSPLAPKGPPALVVPEVVGWRVWGARAKGEAILYSPYKVEKEKVPSGHHKAKCHFFAHHVPPHPHCRCGVYAVESLLDAVFRVHHFEWSVRDDPEFYKENPPSAVFGRVIMKRVIRGGMVNPDTKQWHPDLRAATCDIDELFIPPTWKGKRSPKALAAALGDRYGVPATVGYPKVTDHDRAVRPHWLDNIADSDWAALRIPQPLLSEIRNTSR